MKRLSFLAAVGLCTSLSPMVCSSAGADTVSSLARLAVHRPLAFRHTDGEIGAASPGAFLELTDAAP